MTVFPFFLKISAMTSGEFGGGPSRNPRERLRTINRNIAICAGVLGGVVGGFMGHDIAVHNPSINPWVAIPGGIFIGGVPTGFITLGILELIGPSTRR